MSRPSVLFLCQHNAGRSQLGAALMKHRYGDDVEIWSGGTDPAATISEAGSISLAELGIDNTDQTPRAVTVDDLARADVVVAMKPGLALPAEPTGRYIVWQFPDPADWGVEGIRPLRDEIDRRIQILAAELLD